MLRKLLWSTILAVSIAAGCQTKEPMLERILPVPVGTQVWDTEAQERQEQLEEIVEKHKIPHIADVIYYDDIFKDRYVHGMQSEYGTRKIVAEHFWEEFSKNPYVAVTIIPNKLVGQGKDSMMVVFSDAFNREKEDLLSFLVDHESVHAQDNATGVILAGEKATPEVIKKIGAKKYEDIMELRAYGNQLCQIEDKKRVVSRKTMDFVVEMYCQLHGKILARAMSDKYAKSAIEQAPYFPMFDTQSRKLIIYRVVRKK